MVTILLGQAVDTARMSDNYGEAVQLLTEALQYDPNNSEIYHNRGMAYSYLERWRDAVSDFSHAIALLHHPSSYEQRGMAYYQIGNRDSAFKDWQQALRMNSRRAFALINLAWLAIEEGQFRQALELCSHAILIEPANAKANENRARAYLEMGDRVQSLADLQIARDLIASGRDTSDADLIE
jgi:Flp pilus assembly protein TadD